MIQSPDASRLPPDARPLCRVNGAQIMDWRGYTWVWPDGGTPRVAYDPLVAELAALVGRLWDGMVKAGSAEGPD